MVKSKDKTAKCALSCISLSDFKNWFMGFTENMDGPPNADEWARIQEMLEITKVIRDIDQPLKLDPKTFWPLIGGHSLKTNKVPPWSPDYEPFVTFVA